MSPRDVRTVRFASLIALLVVAGFVVIGVGLQHALDGIQRNNHRIEVNAYKACTDLNAGFKRQNAVIDEAISAERRKPQPNADAINNLNRFRLPIRDCGPRP